MDMGTNTSDVEVRTHRGRANALALDPDAQPSFPLVDVMLPTGGGDHLPIPQINLSISGYEPKSRGSHIRSPDTRAQGNLVIPQLDGPITPPTRDPIRRQVLEDTRFIGQEYSKGGTYIQGASIS